MELKLASPIKALNAALTFNCTLMELKLANGTFTRSEYAAFNCTLMELKHTPVDVLTELANF